MKMYEGLEVTYSSTILDLDTRWKSVISFRLRPLYTRYLFDRMLDGLQSRSGRCGEEKNLLSLPEIELWPSSLHPIAIPTELPRFMYKMLKIEI
jgi:hypothetical protein